MIIKLKKKSSEIFKIIFLIPPRSQKVKYINISNKIKKLIINKKYILIKLKILRNLIMILQIDLVI